MWPMAVLGITNGDWEPFANYRQEGAPAASAGCGHAPSHAPFCLAFVEIGGSKHCLVMVLSPCSVQNFESQNH